MQMGPCNVPVQVNHIGLVAVAHPLHVLLGDVGQLLLRKPVLGMRIQRSVEDRLHETAVLFRIEPGLHDPSAMCGGKPGGVSSRRKHPVAEDHAGPPSVYLETVVRQYAVKRFSGCYSSDHRFPNSSASVRICCCNSVIFLVSCSSRHSIRAAEAAS